MAKPPESTPHSDIDGVHEDESRSIDTANRSGQDSGDLKRASEQTVGRPPYSDDSSDLDDRSK